MVEAAWYLLPNFVLDQFQSQDERIDTKNRFKSDYYKAWFISLATGSSSYILGGASIALMQKDNILIAVAAAVSAVFMATIWHYWGDHSLLAAKAADAIKQGDEEKALEYIKKGADIYNPLPKAGAIFDFTALPLFPIRLYKGYRQDLLDFAIRFNREQVIDFLLLLDIDKKRIIHKLGSISSFKVFQKFIDANVPVNTPPSCKYFSPFYFQILHMADLLEISEDQGIEVKERLKIIDCLINEGATLKPNEASKDKIINVLKNIAQLAGSNDDIKNLVTQICDKL